MADYIPQALRDRVMLRAHHRCEYCQTGQVISGAQMHIEHFVPRVKGGGSDEDNLCLSYAWCNSYKGAKTHGIDPQTGAATLLFHPRQQNWHDHFQWSHDGLTIIGQSPTDRATVEKLNMNNRYIIPARRHWVEAGWHPPANDTAVGHK